MVYTHVKSFTAVKNRKCGQVTSNCRKARPYRADLSLFLNVPVVRVKSEIRVQCTEITNMYDGHCPLPNTVLFLVFYRKLAVINKEFLINFDQGAVDSDCDPDC